MKTPKLLTGAVLSFTLLGSAAFAAVAPSGAALSAPAIVDLASTPQTAILNGNEAFEVVEARLTRAERRARREARRAARAERRAARRGGNNDAPFGLRADGQPRTQPATRSDQRLAENGGELRAANSFSNLNNPDAR